MIWSTSQLSIVTIQAECKAGSALSVPSRDQIYFTLDLTFDRPSTLFWFRHTTHPVPAIYERHLRTAWRQQVLDI